MKKKFPKSEDFSPEDWDAVEFPELTDAELAEARPLSEAMPQLHAAIVETLGRRAAAQDKRPISIRLDADLVEKLRATGPGWQSRVNDVLRRWIEGKAA
ncbi:hypothetical protein E3C22_22815 [Jiella endophytica]|uniref:BrnA antitoxin family protein n=1 Tax=Jiella endophytica TaxID=2558362 RepID=A0A4Y8R8M4_9HYPH|nr:BrnA antitoxin family protein [Jiella endophytica]TFF17968.1 hypothetical protein E3C22_22815 [Jiella endophytica]